MIHRSTAISVDDSDQNELSEFGYKQELRRTMDGYTSFALAFSMITITTTIFTLFAQPFQTVGGAAIWLWLPVMIGVLLIALVYGHLTVRLPVTGYAYQWSSRLVNPHYGWFTGWNAYLATFVGSAGIAVAFATVFAPDFWSSPTHGNVILLASIAIIAAVSLNIVSITIASRLNNVGATAELVGTLGLTAALAVGLAFFSKHQGLSVLTHVGSSAGSPVNIATVGLALLLPVYTLAGWEGSADLAEETHDPRRTAPSAMIRSVVISAVAAFFVYAVFALAIPGDLNKTVNATNENPLVAVFKYHFGQSASVVLQIVAFISIFSALLANITVATRTSFALARDNMLPLSGLWRYVNERTRTPIASTIAVGVVAIGVNFLSSGIATRVLGIVSVAVYLTYGTTLVAVLIGVRRNTIPNAPAQYFSLGRWLVPVTLAGLLWCVIVIAYMTLPAPNKVVGEYTIYFELAGLAWYLLRLRGKLLRGEAGPRNLSPAAQTHMPSRQPAVPPLAGD
jgi:amino acid transporter